MSGQYPYAQPPGTEGLPQSPRRRYPLGQGPSLLTTTLGNAHLSSHGHSGTVQTPSSTTTLSSPFAYPPSPGGALRATSPMSLRAPAVFSGAYNPQQWGSLGNNSPSSARSGASSSRQHSQTTRLAPRLVGPDGIVAGLLCRYSGLTKYDRTCCVSPSTILAPPRRDKRYRTAELTRYYIPVKYRVSRYRSISL